MGTYNLPRNVKGEGRILFIFSTKSLMYTGAAGAIGILMYFIFSLMKMKLVGAICIAVFALIGFLIGTLKVPNFKNMNWARINAGENLDDVILRAIKFRKKGNKIYIYKGGKTNDK